MFWSETTTNPEHDQKPCSKIKEQQMNKKDEMWKSWIEFAAEQKNTLIWQDFIRWAESHYDLNTNGLFESLAEICNKQIGTWQWLGNRK